MRNLLKFIFELGHLKRVPRSGWGLLGIKFPENVAEHSLRTAQIAFFIAVHESRTDPFRACAIAIFHDGCETRMDDPHKVARRYVDVDERRVINDQMSPLGKPGELLHDLLDEYKERKSLDAIIVKDADLVDVAVQAKEYMDSGYLGAEEWIVTAEQGVRTETAKKLLAELREMKLTDWWKGLKKL